MLFCLFPVFVPFSRRLNHRQYPAKIHMDYCQRRRQQQILVASRRQRFNRIVHHRNGFLSIACSLAIVKHRNPTFPSFRHLQLNEKETQKVIFSFLYHIFLFNLFLSIVMLISLFNIRSAQNFLVNLFYIFSFRFVFGDYSTTANADETSTNLPGTTRKFPFISDVLR